MSSFQVDERGFYGEFGGAYVPEILYKCVSDLQNAYLPIIESEEFKAEYHALLKDYVGRPSPGGTKDENTEGLIKIIKHPKMHIISHPGDGSAELDFEKLVLAAKEAHTLLEVNNHSLAPARHKTVARDNNLEILRLCKKYEVPTILGSDAHISFQIADYERLYPLLKETDFPDELIMNYWPDRFFDYLGISRPISGA